MFSTVNVLDFIKVYDETSALLAKKSNKIVVLKVDTIPLLIELRFCTQIAHSLRYLILLMTFYHAHVVVTMIMPNLMIVNFLR